jgi:small conductance mechanosensitive channel
VPPEAALKLFQENLLPVILRLLGAGLIWWIGRRAITFLTALITRGMAMNKLDATLVRYATSILGGAITVFLVLGIVDYLGIPTTSFAALAAGAGLAIGAAWSGMLANFAAGIFLIVMRPFRVGDEITASGVNGVVKEIGLFATTIDTPDEVQTLVGNSKLFSDNIQVHTAYAKRTCRVEFHVQPGADFRPLMQTLEERIAALPRAEPGSARAEFERFTPFSALLSAQAQ